MFLYFPGFLWCLHVCMLSLRRGGDEGGEGGGGYVLQMWDNQIVLQM